MTIEVPMWMVWVFIGSLWLLIFLDLVRAYLNWRIYQLRKQFREMADDYL